MYYLLEHKPLNEFTDAYLRKYPDVNRFMAHAALRYHEDIKVDVPIGFMGPPLTLPQIAERMDEAVLHPNKTFELSFSHNRDLGNSVDPSRNKGYGYEF